jgi:tetratricopeptide (TPR) repeat protein
MQEWHVSADLFRRFLAGRASKDESKCLIRHLLRGCEPCVELTARLVKEGGHWFPIRSAGTSLAEYDQAFDAALTLGTEQRRRVAVERLRGWGQWSSLDPLQPEERLPLVLRDQAFHHWGFYRALLDASRWHSLRDPKAAVEIVALALAVAELLDPAAVGGQEAATDMRAKGWAILGNARRLASDLDGARQALDHAWRLHEQGTGDPLERARLISLDASWIRGTGEFEKAEAALAEALRIYTAAGDDHMQGRTLLQMGDAIGYALPSRGVAYIRRALALINATREPRLELCARHDLAHFLNDAGQPQAALAVLDRARPLYKQFPDDWTQLRLHWLQGKIARGLGHLDEAVHTLRQVWGEFKARDLHHELVIVSIDLAEAYVAQGHHASAARLAGEVYPIMARWGLHRPALAAWLILQNALELRQADELFSRLRIYYRRHWNREAEFTAE